MEPAFAILIGLFFSVAVYLLMSRQLVRVLLGVAIFGNAVNLLIFTSGRLLREVPPVIPAALQVPDVTIANPLPQALILTAIVIGFALVAFAAALILKTYRSTGSVLTSDHTDAEALGSPFDGEGAQNA